MDRVIYTWKSTKLNHFKGFTKRGIDIMKLSVESANRFYKTQLFCDLKSANLMRENKIPFGKIIVVDWLNNFKSENWGLAKLQTMAHQIDPYIHLDLDVIIFNKLKNNGDDIVWGYNEVDLSKFPNGDSNKLSWKSISYHIDNYINNAIKYEKNNLDNFDFGRVTNNSVMIVNDPYPIKDIIEELFKRTKKYNIEFGVSKNMFMEQFLFYQMIKNKDYIKKSIYSDEIYNNLAVPLYNKEPEILNKFLSYDFFHWDNFTNFSNETYKSIYKNISKKINLNKII